MSNDLPLNTLPDQLAMLTNAVAEGAEAVARASMEGWFLPPGQAFWFQVPEAKMTWRLYLVKKQSETFFFFFTHEEAPYVTLDATVVTSIELGLPGEPSEPTLDSLPWMVRFPEFFVTNLTETEFELFTPPGAKREDTVVLSIGEKTEGFLAVQFARKETEGFPKILYSPGKIPRNVENGETRPYSLQPFIDLFLTIHDWSEKGAPGGALTRFEPGNQETPVHKILDALSEGYVACRKVLAQRQPVTCGNLAAASYRLGEYGVEMDLRLKEDGSLSEDPKEERSRLRLRGQVQEIEQPMEIVLAPSVPLVSGPLYDSFFETIFEAIKGPGADVLAELLGPLIKDPTNWWHRVQEFAHSAHDDSVILLSGLGKEDPLYLLLLQGRLYDAPAALLCALEFKTTSPTSVTWNLDGKNDWLARYTADLGNVTISRDAAELIFPIIENIKRWGDIL